MPRRTSPKRGSRPSSKKKRNRSRSLKKASSKQRIRYRGTPINVNCTDGRTADTWLDNKGVRQYLCPCPNGRRPYETLTTKIDINTGEEVDVKQYHCTDELDIGGPRIREYMNVMNEDVNYPIRDVIQARKVLKGLMNGDGDFTILKAFQKLYEGDSDTFKLVKVSGVSDCDGGPTDANTVINKQVREHLPEAPNDESFQKFWTDLNNSLASEMKVRRILSAYTCVDVGSLVLAEMKRRGMEKEYTSWENRNRSTTNLQYEWKYKNEFDLKSKTLKTMSKAPRKESESTSTLSPKRAVSVSTSDDDTGPTAVSL